MPIGRSTKLPFSTRNARSLSTRKITTSFIVLCFIPKKKKKKTRKGWFVVAVDDVAIVAVIYNLS